MFLITLKPKHMIKQDFIASNITYLNTAADGLLSKTNYSRLEQIKSNFQANFTKSRNTFLLEDIPNIRNLAADYIKCDREELSLTQSFSVGFNYLFPSLSQWKRVLLLENDYPSLWMPFGYSNSQIEYVPIIDGLTFSADRIIAKAIDFKPEIIALSHVQYATGYLIDIQTIGNFCKENDIIFIVDGTQALGCVPLNLSELNVDVYASSTYKWMCAGHGCGLMYINKSFQDKITFMTGGSASWFKHGKNWKTSQTIQNLEAGHKDHEAFYRLKFALEDMLQKDMEQVLEHNRQLVKLIKKSCIDNNVKLKTDFNHSETAGIVVLENQNGLFQRLLDNEIYTTSRFEMIRISGHFYNDSNDIEKLNEAFNF